MYIYKQYNLRKKIVYFNWNSKFHKAPKHQRSTHMYKVDFMHCPLIAKRKTIDFENELESDKRVTLAEVLF